MMVKIHGERRTTRFFIFKFQFSTIIDWYKNILGKLEALRKVLGAFGPYHESIFHLSKLEFSYLGYILLIIFNGRRNIKEYKHFRKTT